MEKGGHEQKNMGDLEKLEKSREKADSPLEPLPGNKYSVVNMVLAWSDLCWISDLQDCKVINLCCLK